MLTHINTQTKSDVCHLKFTQTTVHTTNKLSKTRTVKATEFSPGFANSNKKSRFLIHLTKLLSTAILNNDYLESVRIKTTYNEHTITCTVLTANS